MKANYSTAKQFARIWNLRSRIILSSKPLTNALRIANEKLAIAKAAVDRYESSDSWGCEQRCLFCTHDQTVFILPSQENGYDIARKAKEDMEGVK